MMAMLGVRGIPALFLFKDGQVVSNKVGAAPKAASALPQWPPARPAAADAAAAADSADI
jgi:thioredoxin-like negative regulator of GroEL